MNVTYAEIVAKLLTQLERGWITYPSYVSAMESAYNNEKTRVANTRKEWVLIELSIARDKEPQYFSTQSDAQERIQTYTDTYGQEYDTLRTVRLVDGITTVTSLKDDDGDIATFIIQKRAV